MDAAADRRGQRLGGAAAQHATSPSSCTRSCCNRAPAERLELEITETALIRDLNRALTTLRQVEGPGRAHRHGRFRHRLLVALQPAGLPVRQDQDRTGRSSARSTRTSRRPPSCAPCSASATVSACRCWPKASRRLCNSLACAAAGPQSQGHFLGRPGPIETYQDLTSASAHPTVADSAPTRLLA